MAEFDYLGAKQAGASDEEIQSFLKANGTDFDLIGAKQAGATDDEISTFLKSQPVKKKRSFKTYYTSFKQWYYKNFPIIIQFRFIITKSKSESEQ